MKKKENTEFLPEPISEKLINVSKLYLLLEYNIFAEEDAQTDEEELQAAKETRATYMKLQEAKRDLVLTFSSEMLVANEDPEKVASNKAFMEFWRNAQVAVSSAFAMRNILKGMIFHVADFSDLEHYEEIAAGYTDEYLSNLANTNR